MNDRDELIDAIATAKARRQALGDVDDNWEKFEADENRRLYDMSDEDLRAETIEALAVWQKHDRLVRRLRLLREHRTNRVSMLSAAVQEARNKLPALAPPILRDAIMRMEAQVEMRKNLGRVAVTYSHIPGGTVFMSNKNRTAAHEASTVRAEQSLGKLQPLYGVKDVAPLIREIESALSAADMDALFVAPEAPAPAETSAPQGLTKAALQLSNDVVLG